jgi:hypothetical protein
MTVTTPARRLTVDLAVWGMVCGEASESSHELSICASVCARVARTVTASCDPGCRIGVLAMGSFSWLQSDYMHNRNR